MEESILKSTKKILNVPADYTAFDLDITMYINSALSSLSQLGVGPVDGVSITGDSDEWPVLDLPGNQLNMVRTYIYLKTRLLFDPPTSGFLIDAMEKQLSEHEFRLTVFRDEANAEEQSA